jgi:hypothetical protein
MRKEIRRVDKERGIVQITTVDERWYCRTYPDPVTGLPLLDYVPSVTWIASKYPMGVGYFKWLASVGWDESIAIRNAAGDKGSKVHLAVKALLDGETVGMDSSFYNETLNAMEPLNLEEYECLMSFVDWAALAKPEVIDSEYVVWEPSHRYAGMVDLKCRLDLEYLKTFIGPKNFEKGGYRAEDKWAIDFKTSQDVWPSSEIQVSAYRHADPTIDRTAILQLGYRRNKVKYKLTEVPDKFELFLAAKTIWASECEGQAPLQRDFPLSLSLPGARKLEAA